MCAFACTSVSLRFSVHSSHHSGRSRKRFPVACWLSFFWGVLGRSRWFPDASSSPRTPAGLDEQLDESCDGDVEDKLAPELDDNHGSTNKHEVFSSCTDSSFHPWSDVAF